MNPLFIDNHSLYMAKPTFISFFLNPNFWHFLKNELMQENCFFMFRKLWKLSKCQMVQNNNTIRYQKLFKKWTLQMKDLLSKEHYSYKIHYQRNALLTPPFYRRPLYGLPQVLQENLETLPSSSLSKISTLPMKIPV